MMIRNRWVLLLPFLLLFCACGIFKTRIVTRIDSVYIDRTKIVTERIIDTIITINPDTNSYSFVQPSRDTTINLSTKNGGRVSILYKNGIYYITSINKEKAIPIKIYEKKIEYRNIKSVAKNKTVVSKGNFNYTNLFIFLIISIIVITLVLKSKIKHYVPTKIKFW